MPGIKPIELYVDCSQIDEMCSGTPMLAAERILCLVLFKRLEELSKEFPDRKALVYISKKEWGRQVKNFRLQLTDMIKESKRRQRRRMKQIQYVMKMTANAQWN